jgi:hypothetical protein
MKWVLAIWFLSMFVIVFGAMYYATRAQARKYARVYAMMRVRA